MFLSKFNIEAVQSFIRENINSEQKEAKFDYKPSKEIYEFVGPICESTEKFN